LKGQNGKNAQTEEFIFSHLKYYNSLSKESEVYMGCFSKILHLVFIISFIIGIFIFGGKAISNFFKKDSVSTVESITVEQTDAQQKYEEIEGEAKPRAIIFGLLSCVSVVVFIVYILYAVFSGRVALNLRTGQNVYSGNTFFIGFIITLIMVGFWFLDYKFNQFDGTRLILTKFIGSINKK
jgi:hypothetical protein